MGNPDLKRSAAAASALVAAPATGVGTQVAEMKFLTGASGSGRSKQINRLLLWHQILDLTNDPVRNQL
jgi:ABC-type ATPase involved in cell division